MPEDTGGGLTDEDDKKPNAVVMIDDTAVPLRAESVEHPPIYDRLVVEESRMKKAWTWLKKAGVWIALALLGLISMGWLWRRQKSKLGRLEDQLAVEKGVSQVKALQAERTVLKEQDADTAEEMARLDEKIAESRREIRDGFEFGYDATEEELDEELARLGL
jgi:hypothetical protein